MDPYVHHPSSEVSDCSTKGDSNAAPVRRLQRSPLQEPVSQPQLWVALKDMNSASSFRQHVTLDGERKDDNGGGRRRRHRHRSSSSNSSGSGDEERKKKAAE